ncbi:uncharacterized protein LOC106359481 [Brassica napus]|uniref:uncharacterized protein LOC106359481 n=1 Tax=Brassica napus TaxID=3708 RepID=UPI002078F678|nr:uncharacterized protein LOC106359481 [Brassica napus]
MGDGEESTVTKSGTMDSRGVVSATPYSMHASDNLGAMITSVTLTGENYGEWSSEMTNALRAKRKLGFVNGTIPMLLANDSNVELWLSVNLMIVGWIHTSIEPREQLASCRQDGKSVIEFFGRLSKLWEELDMYSPLPSCTCGAAPEIEKAREAEKMHQFVMGLDESRFEGICQSIVSSDSEMDIGEIYAKVVREEQRLNSTKDRKSQQNAIGFTAKTEMDQATSRTGSASSGRRSQCAHCRRTGHDKSNCWQLVGFPDWWEERASSNRGNTRANRGGGRGGRGRGSSGADRSRNTGARVNNAHATTSNSSCFPGFTDEQWAALSQMIDERARPSNDKLSGKTRLGDLILDTGASHHMTGDLSLLVNTSVIPPCPTGFADGNKTFATHVGKLPLTDRVTLEKDRFKRTLIGACRERDGVYYFQDVMAARVHRMTSSVVSTEDQFMWHQRLGHPSFSGPYRTRSSSGAVYFLTIVDDYSRAVWTYFLLEKSEVKPYFREHGVVHQTSCVGTPQQNGCVKRKHIHILNVSRALLFQSKLPVKFWGEAVMTAAHLINRTPTKVLQRRSPYEIFRRCIFTGYPFGQKGWKVYDLEKKEFLISRDVVFYETEFPMASVSVLPQLSVLSPTVASDDDWIFLPESELVLDERGSTDISSERERVAEVAQPSSCVTETEHAIELPLSPPVISDTSVPAQQSSSP